MKVIFNKPLRVLGKSYAKGAASVPDKLAHDSMFKILIKQGAIVLVPKDDQDQRLQALKDKKEAAKAQRKSAKA